MRILVPIRARLLGVLLAMTPLPVLGQDAGITLERGIRSGAEIQIEQLGELLVRNVYIGETEKNLASRVGGLEGTLRSFPVALQMVLVSAREGIVSRYESRTAELEIGKRYSASTWIPRANDLGGRLVAPLKPAEFVIFRIGQKTVTESGQRSVPRACDGSSHAVLMTLSSTDRRFAGSSGTGKTMALCLDAVR